MLGPSSCFSDFSALMLFCLFFLDMDDMDMGLPATFPAFGVVLNSPEKGSLFGERGGRVCPLRRWTRVVSIRC